MVIYYLPLYVGFINVWKFSNHSQRLSIYFLSTIFFLFHLKNGCLRFFYKFHTYFLLIIEKHHVLNRILNMVIFLILELQFIFCAADFNCDTLDSVCHLKAPPLCKIKAPTITADALLLKFEYIKICRSPPVLRPLCTYNHHSCSLRTYRWPCQS